MAKQTKSLFAQIRDEEAAQVVHATFWTSATFRWLLVALAVVAMTLSFPRSGLDTQSGGFDRTLLGTTWTQESVSAEYAFPVAKDANRLRAQQDSARRNTPIVLAEVTGPTIPIATRLSAATGGLSEEARRWVRQSWPDLREAFERAPIVAGLTDSTASSVVVLRAADGSERVAEASSVSDTSAVSASIDRLLASAPSGVRNEVRAAVRPLIDATWALDPVATAAARDAAAASVSTTAEIVRQGDLIVAQGQRLDEGTLRRLAGYRNAQYLRSETPFSFYMLLGSLGHALLIAAFVVLYLLILRPSSFERSGQLGSLLALPVLTGALGWLSIRLEPVVPYEYLIMVPALSMIVTILYEARTALVITMAMALSAGAARADDYGIVLVLLAGGVLGVYSAQNVHSRTQIFTSIIAIFIGLTIATLAVELERTTPVATLWPKLLMATANAVISPLITFAVIIVFERLFNVATDMRLEEFDSLNHDLLKKLNDQAPGTYQHTLAVARLSEAAAIAIGANALLTRVGAYFHDIGKLEKSEYFVENQMNIGNKHDKLPPKRSAAIIRQHVQNGLELAKEYGLPERIWKFIPMHHGTNLIKHFYHLALEEAEGTDGTVDEADFRYPGPKPDSRETAIVMLADAVEALSRLEDTSNRTSLSAAVETIMVDRMMDGQLSNAPLTLQDLDTIRASFVKSLIGMSHKRIRYSGTEEPPRTESGS